MKYVIMLLSEASKIDFAGADKLTKSDHLVILYAKGKKTITAAVQEQLDALKATVDFTEIAQTADAWLHVAYLLGYHVASKHDTYVVTKDKTKVPTKLTADAHIYTGFKTITGATSSSSSSSKKTTTSTKKATTSTKKTTTSTKKSTSSSSAKKSTTASKKSTTSSSKKSTTTKKKTTKSNEIDIGGVIGSFVSGDKKKAKEGLMDIAGQILGG
ncbi:MAG: hypothetical protein MJ172_03350 [Clostridia bacterium]|nr:hypothetical protein [Clostridia bacterium]